MSARDFYRDLGQRIRAAREAKGWTQARLGSELDHTHVAIHYWETGRSWPSLWILRRIEAVTGERIV